MTTPPTPASPLPDLSDKTRSTIPPLLFLIGQLIVLAIGAARVELTARSGDLPQRLAVREMIAFQLAISSLSFTTVLNPTVIIGSGLFLFLAGSITQTTTIAMVWTIVTVLLWLIALNQLSRLIKNGWARSIVISIISTATVGLPIARYLIADFSEHSVRWNDPISTVIRQSTSDALLPGTIALWSACAAFVIFFSLCKRARDRV